MYTEPMVTIELKQYNSMLKEIEALKKPADGEELTELEQQEATGLLLVRSLNNPGYFKNITGEPLDLGKYLAQVVIISDLATNSAAPQTPRIKFRRK